MPSRKLALLVTPMLLLAIVPGVASAAPPKDPKAAHHAKVVAYWTPERMRNAKARDFTFDPVKGFKPTAKPGPGAGGGVTGASWTGGGDILNGTGRVLFTLGGTDYICSGSIVADSSSAQSIVLMILVIETASAACSVALIEDDRLVDERHELVGRGHAEREAQGHERLRGRGLAVEEHRRGEQADGEEGRIRLGHA